MLDKRGDDRRAGDGFRSCPIMDDSPATTCDIRHQEFLFDRLHCRRLELPAAGPFDPIFKPDVEACGRLAAADSYRAPLPRMAFSAPAHHRTVRQSLYPIQ